MADAGDCESDAPLIQGMNVSLRTAKECLKNDASILSRSWECAGAGSRSLRLPLCTPVLECYRCRKRFCWSGTSLSFLTTETSISGSRLFVIEAAY